MSRAGLRVHAFADLTKVRIAVLSTLSAATGYVVFARALNPGLLTAASGVFLFASEPQRDIDMACKMSSVNLDSPFTATVIAGCLTK